MVLDRNAAAIVGDRQETLCIEADLDEIGVACDGLVHGVVDDFGKEVVQRLLVRAANIHAGTAAHRFQPFQHLDGGGVVAARIGPAGAARLSAATGAAARCTASGVVAAGRAAAAAGAFAGGFGAAGMAEKRSSVMPSFGSFSSNLLSGRVSLAGRHLPIVSAAGAVATGCSRLRHRAGKDVPGSSRLKSAANHRASSGAVPVPFTPERLRCGRAGGKALGKAKEIPARMSTVHFIAGVRRHGLIRFAIAVAGMALALGSAAPAAQSC